MGRALGYGNAFGAGSGPGHREGRGYPPFPLSNALWRPLDLYGVGHERVLIGIDGGGDFAGRHNAVHPSGGLRERALHREERHLVPRMSLAAPDICIAAVRLTRDVGVGDGGVGCTVVLVVALPALELSVREMGDFVGHDGDCMALLSVHWFVDVGRPVGVGVCWC